MSGWREGPLANWIPAAVVFDCDGLLVDTEPCWTVAETELFARRGLPFGREQKELLIGRSLGAASEALADVFGEQGGAGSIAAELLDLATGVISTQAVAMPGAHEVVELVRARVPVAVATNSPRTLMDAALERGGFSSAFEVRIAADDVERPKPEPDLYLAACRSLGVEPHRCLAFEDSMTGVRSAQAAGLRLVSVPTFTTPDFPGDWVLGSLSDPVLGDWIREWTPR